MEKNLAAKTNETLRQVQTQFNCAMESHPDDCKCVLCDHMDFEVEDINLVRLSPEPQLPPLIPPPGPTKTEHDFYKDILQRDQVHFAFVTRKLGGLAHFSKKYVGYGATYTEAILSAYDKAHQYEAHAFLFDVMRCPICDLLRCNKIVTANLANDEICVGIGNLYEMHKEFN